MTNAYDILGTIDPDDTNNRYIAFRLPPEPDYPDDDDPQIGIEYHQVFHHDNFHSITYDGVMFSPDIDTDDLHIYPATDNVFVPADGWTVDQCLALLAAHPKFTVVDTPPGNHEP